MRIGEWECRGTGEVIPRFTLRNRLVVFRPESSSWGLELSFSGLSRPGSLSCQAPAARFLPLSTGF
jgi:hypothetical protein